MQLAEIHESIQRMRVENASETQRLCSNNSSSVHSRLSTSCPSLNNDNENNNNGVENNGNEVASPPVNAYATNNAGGRPVARNKKHGNQYAGFASSSANAESKHRSKRQGRQRR